MYPLEQSTSSYAAGVLIDTKLWDCRITSHTLSKANPASMTQFLLLEEQRAENDPLLIYIVILSLEID